MSKTAAVIPAAFVSIGYLNTGVFKGISKYINSGISQEPKYGIISTNNYYELTGYIQLFIMSLIAGLTILGVVLVCDNIKDKITAVYILLIGAATRMMLMFTPNITVSSYRTCIFAWFSLIAAFIYVADVNYKGVVEPYLNKKDNKFLRTALPTAMILIAAFCFKNNAEGFFKNLSLIAG